MTKNIQMNDRIYLSPPCLGNLESEYVQKAIKSNWIATVGSYIDEFESRLENYLGESKHVVALNSGTSAIHLGLKILGVTSGDEVLVQSHTHIASVNPIVYLGAIPIFIDSEPDTWNMCPKYLEIAIKDRISKGKHPKAIIVVDLYGMPYKVEEIKLISMRYNIPILEDAAEALGSEYKNQKCGTFGDVGVISFNGNKIVTTSGGGALILKSKHLKEKAVYLATQAKEHKPYFEHTEIGYNYRMTNIAASIGCAQLSRIDALVFNRKQVNRFYKELFLDKIDFLLQDNITDKFNSNFWLTTLLFRNYKYNNESLRLFLELENIESRRLWKPMHIQPVFKSAIYYGAKVSEDLFDKGLCLPSSISLENENKTNIKQTINSFFDFKF